MNSAAVSVLVQSTGLRIHWQISAGYPLGYFAIVSSFNSLANLLTYDSTKRFVLVGPPIAFSSSWKARQSTAPGEIILARWTRSRSTDLPGNRFVHELA